MTADDRERRLLERLERIDALEKEVLERERALKASEGAKKQVLLRVSPSLWDEVARWAEEDFRSINGQIEFILADAVRKRKSQPK